MLTSISTALALAALLAGWFAGPSAPAATHHVAGSAGTFDGTQGGPPGSPVLP